MRNLQDIETKENQSILMDQDGTKGEPVKEKKIECYLYGKN